MPFISYSSLLGALFMIILGVIVLFSNRKTKLSVIFLLLCISISIWLISTFLMFASNNDIMAIFWDRIGYIGVIFIPILMYNFSLIFSGRDREKKISLVIGYLLTFVFVIASRSSLFLNGVYRYDWGIHAKAEILHHLFLLFFVLYIVQFYIEVYSVYKKEFGIKREQARYIFAGFVLMLVGSLGFLPAYGIGIYPSGYIGEILGAIVIAYAILRYRFMDIIFVIGRSFIYVFSYVVIIGSAYLFILLNSSFNYLIPEKSLFIILIFTSVAVYSPVFGFFERIAEKYFYYNFYSYRKVLGELGKRINRILEVDQLCKLLTETIAKTMHFDRVLVALNVEQRYFAPVNNLGFDNKQIAAFFKNEVVSLVIFSHQVVLNQ